MARRKWKTYEGSVIEKGGTSIKAKVSPSVVWLFKKGYVKPGDRVLDYGAGKYARNAKWLIARGCEVYAYDPYNAKPYEYSALVRPRLPPRRVKFDVGLSVFVLNVVQAEEEKRIILDMMGRCKRNFHVVRNEDLLMSVKNALEVRRGPVWTFWNNEYKKHRVSGSCEEFCRFGVKTRRGFQRLTDATGKLLRRVNPYKIYIG